EPSITYLETPVALIRTGIRKPGALNRGYSMFLPMLKNLPMI
ncbi:MAG: hypothetical protein ACI9BW_003670, partial [Gammaproteobacteria bacterium]